MRDDQALELDETERCQHEEHYDVDDDDDLGHWIYQECHLYCRAKLEPLDINLKLATLLDNDSNCCCNPIGKSE